MWSSIRYHLAPALCFFFVIKSFYHESAKQGLMMDKISVFKFFSKRRAKQHQSLQGSVVGNRNPICTSSNIQLSNFAVDVNKLFELIGLQEKSWFGLLLG